MKKLLYILMLIPALLSAQTYNVSITNSLLGPVTLEFTNTQVTASGAVVTGTVINAAITNTFSASVTNEFSASVTNTFAPVNNITNEITVGGTTVNNTNTFITYVTNQVDVAGVVNNVYITNITQTILTTAGVQSISFTGAVDGAITLAGNAVTQTGTTFNISYVDLGYTSIVSQGSGNVVTNIVGLGSRIITQQLGTVSGGGGFNHFGSDTGTTTLAGSWLYPTTQVAVVSNGTVSLFFGTNQSLAITRPDGTANGGRIVGARAISLVTHEGIFSSAQGSDSVAIGPTASAADGTLSPDVNVAIGYAAYANSGGIGIGYVAQAQDNYDIAIGHSADAGASGATDIAIGRNATIGNFYSYGLAIGYRSRVQNQSAAIISSSDTSTTTKNTQADHSITLSFTNGLFLTATNTQFARISPTEIWHTTNQWTIAYRPLVRTNVSDTTTILPRYVGDELMDVNSTNRRIWQSFGGTTNDWQLIYP